MAIHSPEFGLTLVNKDGKPSGWMKWVGGRSRWVCNISEAPTGEAADRIYARKYGAGEFQGPRRVAPVEMDVATLADQYMQHQLGRLRQGQIEQRSYDDCLLAILDFTGLVGRDEIAVELSPADFAAVRASLSKRFGPHRLGVWITYVRAMFKWAMQPPLRMPAPDYGHEFAMPSAKAYRLAKKARRDESGPQVFESHEISVMLENASPRMQAAVLLGVNCGLGPADLVRLPWSAIDMDAGLLNYARHKTGVDRRGVIWPETLQALRLLKPSGPLVFGGNYHAFAVAFGRLLKKCKLRLRGHYCLRRTCRTHADECGDQRAAALIAGHETGDMGSVYVEHVSLSRLRKVSEHVRAKALGGSVAGIGPVSRRRGQSHE